MCGVGFVWAARSGMIDLSEVGAPEWLWPSQSQSVAQSADPQKNAASPQKQEKADNSKSNDAAAAENMDVPQPELPKAPDPIPPSTAMTRQIIYAGVLNAVMDKSAALVNAGNLDSTDTFFQYMEDNKAYFGTAELGQYQALSEKTAQFKEIIKTATKIKNGAREGHACEPIAALQKNIPEDAVGMIEKVEKLRQSCQSNLSRVPDVL